MSKLSEKGLQEEYIDPKAAEGQRLDYKAAASLGTDSKRREEIIKDTTAFANAAGGRIFYGVTENKVENQPGLPDKIDPITDPRLNRDWLTQVINNADPPILGVEVESVSVSTGGFVLVVDIPQSTRAHMALDGRYYRRTNTENLWMTDDQVQDVRNRSIHPVVEARIRSTASVTDPVQQVHQVQVFTSIVNLGNTVAHNYMLDLFFPDLVDYACRFLSHTDPSKAQHRMQFNPSNQDRSHVHRLPAPQGYCAVRIISNRVLFPTEELDLNQEILIRFTADNDVRSHRERIQPLRWVVFADNMPRREVDVPFSTLVDAP